MPAVEMGFIRTSVTLRPPRIAILFRDDQRWRDWAMYAIQVASSYWGGGGFILVPYDPKDGSARESLAAVVRAYDPDHVVSLRVPAQQIETWYPGTFAVHGVDDEEERQRLLQHANFDDPDEASLTARKQVASWCSPMRAERALGARNVSRELHKTLGMANAEGRWGDSFAPSPGGHGLQVLAASPSWRSDVGLYAALRLGIAQEMTQAAPRVDPEMDAFPWLVGGNGPAPASVVFHRNRDEVVPTSPETLFVAGQRLMTISRGYLRDRVVVVVGDTAADFALAAAYDRMTGRGVWITRAMLEDQETLRRVVKPALQSLQYELERSASYLVVTSTSMAREDLESLASVIEVPDVWFEDERGTPVSARARRETVQVREPELEQGVFSLAVEDEVGSPIALPTTRRIDGSYESLIGLDSPIPKDLLFDGSNVRIPYWYVDVSIHRDPTPRGRDIPSHALVAEEGPFAEVNLRASRDGYSFSPHSMGFVPSGALLNSRIGKPIIRELSMTAWVRGMAEREGLTVRLSAAGRRAELAASRLGGRSELLELLTPEVLDLLRKFQRRDRRPRRGEQDREVFVEGLNPYLSLKAFERSLPSASATDRNALFDKFLSTGLVRRGLMLQCGECERPSFIDVDRLGRRYECPQCGADNSLVSSRWKNTDLEPTWFYDLYAPMRDLLGENGELTLATASALRKGAPQYSDTPELEFIDSATDQPVAEIDVVASVSGSVFVVEAKSNGTFGGVAARKSQTAKLIRVATALRADQIVLATSREAWAPADVQWLNELAAERRPFPIQVGVLTSVGEAPALTVGAISGGAAARPIDSLTE